MFTKIIFINQASLSNIQVWDTVSSLELSFALYPRYMI